MTRSWPDAGGGRVDSVVLETAYCAVLHCTNYGSYGVPPTLMVEVVETA